MDSYNISMASTTPHLPLTFSAVSMWEVPGESLSSCLCFEQPQVMDNGHAKMKNMANFPFHADLNIFHSLSLRIMRD